MSRLTPKDITMISPTRFAPHLRVAYIPTHAHKDLSHKDVEHGTVSSVNEKYVFVKFDKQIHNLGWNGATAKSCDPGDLVIL